MWALGFADPNKSVNEMQEPQNLISPYSFDESSILKSVKLATKARSSFLLRKQTSVSHEAQQNTFGTAQDADPITFEEPATIEKLDDGWFKDAPKKKD